MISNFRTTSQLLYYRLRAGFWRPRLQTAPHCRGQAHIAHSYIEALQGQARISPATSAVTLELLNCHSKKEKIHNQIPLSSFNSLFLCIPHTNIRDIKVQGAINTETDNQKHMASISTPNNLYLRSMRRLLTPGQKSSSQSGSWLKFCFKGRELLST